jgi:hypothetical protein
MDSTTGNNLPTIEEFENDIENQTNRAEKKNPFPVEVMPVVIQGIINETLKTLNYPVDYTATGILYAASLGIGTTHKVELKKGHQANAILWCAIVGSSGVMKTHPLNFALRPILDKDNENVKRYKQALDLYKEYQAMDRKEKKEFGPMAAPQFTKTILSDTTIEALGVIHDVNRRGIGIYRDEFAGWFKNFSRYSSGSEVETWLTLWNGDPLITDRKQGDKVFINESFVSVLGGIQPDLLDQISSKGGDSNGFLSRILFAFPKGLVRQPWNYNDLSDATVNRYRHVIEKLLKLPDDDTKILEFDPQAREMIMDWQSKLTESINDAAEPLKVPLAKIDTYGLRLCLIMQLLRWACDEGGKESIGVESVKAGLKITDYFRVNAVEVHTYLQTTPLDKISKNTRDWYDQLTEKFTTKQAKELADKLKLEGLSQRNVNNLLERTDLFKKLYHGTYKKLYA